MPEEGSNCEALMAEKLAKHQAMFESFLDHPFVREVMEEARRRQEISRTYLEPKGGPVLEDGLIKLQKITANEMNFHVMEELINGHLFRDAYERGAGRIREEYRDRQRLREVADSTVAGQGGGPGGTRQPVPAGLRAFDPEHLR